MKTLYCVALPNGFYRLLNEQGQAIAEVWGSHRVWAALYAERRKEGLDNVSFEMVPIQAEDLAKWPGLTSKWVLTPE